MTADLAPARDRKQNLVDVESASVFRDWYHRGYLTEQRFRDAVADLLDLPFTRFPVGPLLPRAVDLRDYLTAYDACYVALAEATVGDTADRRCAARHRPGHRVPRRGAARRMSPTAQGRWVNDGLRFSRNAENASWASSTIAAEAISSVA